MTQVEICWDTKDGVQYCSMYITHSPLIICLANCMGMKCLNSNMLICHHMARSCPSLLFHSEITLSLSIHLESKAQCRHWLYSIICTEVRGGKGCMQKAPTSLRSKKDEEVYLAKSLECEKTQYKIIHACIIICKARWSFCRAAPLL